MFNRLRERCSIAKLIELAAASGWENYLGRTDRVCGFESEHFLQCGRLTDVTTGVACHD